MNVRRGFTLWETVTVLGITTLLAIVMTRPATQTQYALAERAFWPAWDRFWQYGQHYTRTHRCELMVQIANRSVSYYTIASQSKLIRRLTIPPSLQQVPDGRRSWVIRPTGWSPTQKLVWYSRATHQWWQLQSDLKGAMFRVSSSYHRPT